MNTLGSNYFSILDPQPGIQVKLERNGVVHPIYISLKIFLNGLDSGADIRHEIDPINYAYQTDYWAVSPVRWQFRFNAQFLKQIKHFNLVWNEDSILADLNKPICMYTDLIKEKMRFMGTEKEARAWGYRFLDCFID